MSHLYRSPSSCVVFTVLVALLTVLPSHLLAQPGTLYIVTTLDDHDDGICDSDCTLREAILAANARIGADGIRFLVTGAINLKSTLPTIFDSLTINGPGADLLTVRRDTGGDYRIFTVRHPFPGTVTLANMTIALGRVPCPCPPEFSVTSGGAVFHAGDVLNIVNSTLIGNSAGDGGAIYSGGSRLNVTNSVISNNFSSSWGGAIFASTQAVIVGTTLANNSASTGGAIFNNFGNVRVSRSTLRDNSAGIAGGGVYNRFGEVSVSNSTLSRNSAQHGGGISSLGNSKTLVENTTISGNTAVDDPDGFPGGGGGGIESWEGGLVVVSSSIVALNSATGAGPDVHGPFNSQGFNLIGITDGSRGFSSSIDQIGTAASPLDPKLDPAGLQLNGGLTRTIALQPGSPAIDKGIGNSLITDQRGPGFLRTFSDLSIPNAPGGDGTDVGALEVQPATGDNDQDGVPDNSDPDTLADGISSLPIEDFNGLGNRTAFLSRLAEIELLIFTGNIDQAIQELQNLRRRADGCGSAADSNDWITDCDSQLHVRALIDTLIANLLN